jgi:hypothetical protein
MKLYTFPSDSIDYVEESKALENLKVRAGGESWYMWPELCLSMKQRQEFKPPNETTSAIVSNDPFIISAFKKEDVIICKAQKNRCVIKGSPDFQTFGSAVEYLIPEMFDAKVLISEEAIKYLQKAVKSSSMKKVREAISKLGESFEKRFLYQRACELHEQKKKQKKKKSGRKRGKPKGRGLTTGRFNTRKELVDKILFLHEDTSCSCARIARNCEISETTVAKIIENKK